MMIEHDDTKRPLTLDDENDVAATICLVATSAGHEGEHTVDEDVLLERVVAWQPTHVVVDLQLRDRDGVEVLQQLARCPFSERKIDQMLVKGPEKSLESRKIASAVVGLGKSMDLNDVAEGVEDEWALDFLRNRCCDEAQGYFIARPMDSVAANQWVAAASRSRS